jgi:hypothetical protein
VYDRQLRETNRIDIDIRPTGRGALLDVAAALLPNATDAETQTLSVPVRLRRCGRGIRMLERESTRSTG